MLETRYARAWSAWENALASINASGVSSESPAEYARAFARLENHYFQNRLFLDDSTDILPNVHKLHGIRGHIVQGRFDMICPPQAAWDLAQAWPDAKLKLVAKAGHALSDTSISAELVRIMNDLRL